VFGKLAFGLTVVGPSTAELVVIVGLPVMFCSCWTVIKHLLVHYRSHYLKCFLLLRKVYGDLDSIELRVEPEPSVLIYSE